MTDRARPTLITPKLALSSLQLLFVMLVYFLFSRFSFARAISSETPLGAPRAAGPRARESGLDFELRVTGGEIGAFQGLFGEDVPVVDQGDGDLAVAPAKPKLKRPPLYRVILLNDDYTPMEFVVQVLEQFFGMNREQATQVMLAVHTKGKGVCGIYPQDIAETKASRVNESARESGHPLLCEVEPSTDDED